MENFLILLLFGIGCIGGILLFSRFLSFMLSRFHNITMAVLTGLMCGSLRKVWPWKEVLESVVIRNKIHVLQDQNILPGSFDGEVLTTMAMAVAGCMVVLMLSRLATE